VSFVAFSIVNQRFCRLMGQNLMGAVMKKLMMALALATATSPALAEATISQCAGPARVDAIVEPWSKATRTFANGAIRLVLLDTIEPACCYAHLAILAPNPGDELGARQCVALSDGSEWTGFQSIDLAGAKSSYDPAKGLLLSIPVERYIDGIRSHKAVIDVRINQATGAITLD
jgi:hypothetical protein